MRKDFIITVTKVVVEGGFMEVYSEISNMDPFDPPLRGIIESNTMMSFSAFNIYVNHEAPSYIEDDFFESHVALLLIPLDTITYRNLKANDLFTKNKLILQTYDQKD